MLLLSVRAKGEGLGFRSVQGGAVQQCRCTSMLAAPAISSPLTGKQIPRSLPYILHFLELIGQLGGEGFSVLRSTIRQKSVQLIFLRKNQM